MKRLVSFFLAVAMLCSIGFVMPASAAEAVDYKSKICTIENENGFLVPSLADKGKALTVDKESVEWRVKGYLDGSLSFIGESGLAADVDGNSKKAGATVLHWTSTGALNQRWFLEETEGGYYIKSASSNLYITETDGAITQEEKSDKLNQVWKLEIKGEFEPVVEKMLESKAAKSLSEYKHERLYTYLMAGGDYNVMAYNKVEIMIMERDYFNLPFEEQVKFVEECFTVEPVYLHNGYMSNKIERDIKVEYVGIIEDAWYEWHGIPEEDARLYNITITDKETGDSYTFEYVCPYDNDEEYAIMVGEAVGAFEMPVAKSLKRFIFTGMNTSSWNGGGGMVWNNTKSRGDADFMIPYFAHEIGHVLDTEDTSIWNRAKALDMVPVTGYGQTNRWEDLAEFSRIFLQARADETRLKSIEMTHPARTKAFKALLYTKDKNFYADYADEYEEVMAGTGDYDKSVIAKLAVDGKYLADVNGEIIFTDKASDMNQVWEIYSERRGNSKIINKATGKYLVVNKGVLTLAEEGKYLGLQSAEDGYKMVDATTAFTVDDDLTAQVDGDLVWQVEEVGKLAFTGDYAIRLQVTGKYLAYDGESLVFSDEPVEWSISPVDKDYYIIRDKATGKAFDINGNSKAEGAKALIWTVTGGTNQHFKLVSDGYGAYKLELRHSGLYLTATEEGFCQSSGALGLTSWNIIKVN